MDDIIKEFLIENYENLDRLDRDLVELEKEPENAEVLSSIFRTIHTLKGSAGFLGYSQLETVSHAAENLLSRMREGSLVINPQIAGALLSTVDVVRIMLAEIEATGAPEERDHSALIDLLERLKDGHDDAGYAPPVDEPVPFQGSETVYEAEHDPESYTSETPQEVHSHDVHHSVEPEYAAESHPAHSGHSVAPASNRPAAQPIASQPPSNSHPEAGEHRAGSASDSTIRVDVGLLDKLMNLVGELVLARNQVLQFTNQHMDGAFLATAQRLNLITTELQGSAMKTRMQPIGNIWGKLPRVVRDLSTGCGKDIRLEMEGKETEMDKTIIEAIKDPLTHIVRNSVDHGIELPEVRVSRGKPAQGCLKMRAFHEGGQVNIEIVDDGGGIDLERVKNKAIQRGLVSVESAARMGDHEALQLIFMPGFSTAEKVTNVSGRGVGMDVVKTNIEKIGGTVDLQSQLGRGTTLKIKIPLTLAIIPALVITSGGERFAIPQISLLELVRLEPEMAGRQIESIHGAPVYRLRGKLLPLVYLNRELRLQTASAETLSENGVNIVVLQADGHPFGLVVDEINDTQEIVVKPLGKQIKNVACFAGATIMGDGKVALILDVLGLAQQSRVLNEVHNRNPLLDASGDGRKSGDESQTLLLFSAGKNSRIAIPLSMVARLEELPRSSVEYSAGKPVVRYRGQIMPLVNVSDFLPSLELSETQPSASDPMQVVVHSHNGRSVGLIVGSIDDIVSEVTTVKRMAHGNGILGSVVVQDRVTDLLDVQSIIRSADPTLLEEHPSAPAA